MGFGRAFRVLYAVVALLLTLLISVLNARLYLPPSDDYNDERVGADVEPQLRFVGESLREGAGERMQALFPEGFFSRTAKRAGMRYTRVL